LEKHKIALFIRSLLKGGAEKQSIILAHYLEKYHSVYLILTYQTGEYLEFANMLGVKTVSLDGSMPVKLFNLYKFLRKEKIRFLFNYLPSNNVIGGIIGKMAGVRYIFGGLRRDNINASPAKMFLQRFVCNYLSTGYISNSYSAKKVYANQGFNEKKLSVIQNCIEPVQVNNKKNGQQFVILSVGRFVKEKDYTTAIDAVQLFISFHPEHREDIVYKIIGWGELEQQIRQYVNLNGLENNINIIDGRTDIEQFYHNATIYLSTSLYEGMSNSIMEAMNYGLPVVATECGDIRYLVRNGSNGFIRPVKDVQGLAEKIDYLYKNPAVVREMSIQSNALIAENFSPESMLEKYLSLIGSFPD
jgi:glycosyltransferase involved in cell wall biosynthesis